MKKTILIFVISLCAMFLLPSLWEGSGMDCFAQTGISDINFTPQSMLHVHINAPSGNLLQLTNTTTGNGDNIVGFKLNYNNNDISFINNQAGYMSFYTSNLERMRILSGGNVGIGTTAPASKLHIAIPGSGEAARITAYGSVNPTITMGEDNSAPGVGYISLWWASTPVERIRLTANTANPSYINAGNVGIGTVAPGYKLDVQGGSLNVGTLYGTYVMYGTLGSFDTRATNPWPETYNMGVTSEFKGNAANGLNDGGSYNSVLSIRQWSSGIDWSGGGVSQLGFTPNGNIWHRYSQTTGSWGSWKKLYDSGNGGLITCGSTNYVVKSDGTNGVCSQIFDNGTNVGIGTASPGAILDVGTTPTCCAAQVPTIGVSELTSSNGRLPWIQFHTGGFQEAFLRLASSSRTLEIGDAQNIGVELAIMNNAANARNVVISGKSSSYFMGGNVGIGTTAPAYQLHIQNTGGASNAKIGYSSAYTDNKLYFGDGAYVYVGENVADDRLYLRGGSLSIDIGGGLGAAGNVLTSNGTTVNWAAPVGGGIGGSGTLNYIPLWTPNGTTLGNSRFMQPDGNSICLNGFYSWKPCAVSIYPVNTSTLWAIDGSSLNGSTTSGTGWQYATAGGGGIMGLLETAGSYKAGVLGLIYTTGNENTAGVLGGNEAQTYFGALSFYKNALWYAGWFDGEVNITSNDAARNTLNVSGSVNSPQAIGRFTNSSVAVSDAYAVDGYSRPQDYWGIGGRFEGGYMGVQALVYPTGSNSYFGLYGVVSGGSGTNYGVYGWAGGAGTNWAGYFGGNVALGGALQANGSFGTAGQVLISNGAAAAYWGAAGGAGLWTQSGNYIYPNSNSNVQVDFNGANTYGIYVNKAAPASSPANYFYDGINNNGTDYNTGLTATVRAYRYWGSTLSAAIQGLTYGDYNQSAGVEGYHQNTGAWGALAYKNSGATAYGVYGSAAGWGSGGGFMPTGVQTGIGSGGYGGIMGGWSRGEVLGFTSCGELYAAYNIGNVYTSGHQAEIVTVGDKRVAAYSVTSTNIEIYNHGKSKLTDGKARVKFEDTFAQLIGDNIPDVTISPMGQCNGIFIKNVDSKGFDVEELNGGTSNVEFSFIVIGKRIDADVNSELPEALTDKDFDNKMKGVMFNENNLDRNATPIWWDGTKIRFDKLPESGIVKKEPEKKDAINIKTSGTITEDKGKNINQNNIIPAKTEKEQFEIQKQKNAEDASKKMNEESIANYKKYQEEKKNIKKQTKSQNSTTKSPIE